MTHRQIQKQLSAYLDSELSARKRERIESHLLTCKECSQIVLEFRENRSGIAELRQPTPSGIWEAIREQIIRGQQVERWIRFCDVWQQRFFRPALAGGGLLVIACFIMAVIYLYPAHDSAEDPLEYYAMIHARYTSQAMLVQNISIDEFKANGRDQDVELSLPMDTQIFLNAHFYSD